MSAETGFQTAFVTDLEALFFEIGKLLALCKTSDQQRTLLDKILADIEASKEYSHPNESLEDDEIVVKEQLFRHYQKGFARWGLAELSEKETITDESVAKKGGLLSFDEETRHHEKSIIPHSLLLAFHKGWMFQKLAEDNTTQTPSNTTIKHA